ncbi:MAG: M14 family metallopeptidase [Candidatus Aminicenantes bacterium]|nr:M14 family metallopeptidase [Candidatus Aminicenantes bacterium]
MRRAFLLIFALAIIASLLPAQIRDTKIISLPQTSAVLDAAARLGLDLLAEIDGRIFIAVSPSDLRKIEKLGLFYLCDTRTLAPPASSTGPESSTSPIGAYHTHQELEDDLTALQSRFPELAKIIVVGFSLENRPILALKVSDNPGADEGEPAVLFLGCHHAREWISVEIPFLFGRYLLENYGSDPEVRRLVDAAEIWIVPMVNPDGHDYTVRVYRYWRKNRRANDDGTFGVDLNRNYGQAWGCDDFGSSPDPAADVYRGTTAFSEPETQAVRNLILGRNFGSMISYHSYSQLLTYPWGYTTLPTRQSALLHDLGLQLAGLMTAVNGREYFCGQSGTALYLTNGDTTDWAYAVTGMPAYTIELPPVDYLGGGFFNREEDIAPIFQENLPAMLALVDWTIAHPNPVPELSGGSRPFPRAWSSASGTIKK